MAWKSILAHVDTSRAAAPRLAAVMALARAEGAVVTGLHAAEEFQIPGYAEIQIPHEVIEQHAAQRREIRAEAERLFRSAAAEAGVECAWIAVTGEPVVVLTAHSRFADLVVVGFPVTNDPLCCSEGIAERLVLASGRPVLVLPAAPALGAVEPSALVAWDGGREAARAIGDALPLLARARRVDVVCVEAQARESRASVEDVCAHLARHGIDATPVSLPGRKDSAEEVLIEHARKNGLDLMVMGAYGRSRMREMVLGGVTASVLGDGTVAALLAH